MTWYFFDIGIRSYVIVLARYGIVLDHNVVYIFLEFFLKWNMYTSKKRSIQDLAPSSECLQGYLWRCHYFIRLCRKLCWSQTCCVWNKLYLDGSTRDLHCIQKSVFLEMPTVYFITWRCTNCTRKCSCHYSDLECMEYCKCGENCQNIF